MFFGKKDFLKKMRKNCKEAMKDRAPLLYPFYKGVYASLNQVFLSKRPIPLFFTYEAEALRGKRAKMEDAHIFAEREGGILTGVFDGHNGNEVSLHVASRIPELFFRVLDQKKGGVYLAFKELFLKLQQELEKERPEWRGIGSTAVVCYLEKATNYVYTATLGDSEATLYRKVHKRYRSIPLSCVRNWSTKRDFKSARKALGERLPGKKNPKEMRHPPPGESVRSGYGLNVSRALGDALFKGVIHSPKITVNTVLGGDVLLLSCDGLKDFVSEKEVVEIVTYHQGRPSLVHDLADYALTVKNSDDNVTVLGVFIFTDEE